MKPIVVSLFEAKNNILQAPLNWVCKELLPIVEDQDIGCVGNKEIHKFLVLGVR